MEIKDLLKVGYLRIKVTPKSSKNEITEILADSTIKIRIKAAPEKGKANKELIKYLSQILEVRPDNISIISGQHDQLKLVKVKTDGPN